MSHSKWWTTEMNIYFAIVFASIISMSITAYNFCKSDRPDYDQYKHLLSQGWIFRRPVDNSDGQYRGFRENLPILVPVMLAHVLLSNGLLWAFNAHGDAAAFTTSRSKPISLHAGISLVFSVVFLLTLNGVSGFVKNLAIITTSYYISAKLRGSVWNPICTWAFGCFILFAADWSRGLPLHGIPGLSILELHRGVQPRWWDSLRFTMLRMISYNMDYYWRCQRASDTKAELEKHLTKCDTCRNGDKCQKIRTEQHLPEQEYNYALYVTYMFYVPLFIAGPIITYNDFSCQMKKKPAELTYSRLAVKTARWCATFLFFEFALHFFYVVAINKSKAWLVGFTPLEVAILGYFNLKHIWLKLLIIWRFFGLWAEADGVETVDNMHRCMSNNYSASGFWRSWHRSYNRWLIRYVYVPLGGNKRYAINLLLVFTFVAIWHDLDLNLLAWGWLVALFILPEMAAQWLTRGEKWQKWDYYLYLCGLGAVLNILMMISVNLIGFAGGVTNIYNMYKDGIVGNGSITFVIGVFAYLYSSSMIMFEVRESEKRQGIKSRD